MKSERFSKKRDGPKFVLNTQTKELINLLFCIYLRLSVLCHVCYRTSFEDKLKRKLLLEVDVLSRIENFRSLSKSYPFMFICNVTLGSSLRTNTNYLRISDVF